MTFNEAVGVHACDIDNETGKRLTFRELNIRYIKQLGGLDVVKKYIPFEVDYLLPKYREDRYFNNTPLEMWDYYAKSMKIHCYWHDVTCTSQAERVCVLKEAAAILCEQATSECYVENEVLF